MHLSSGLISDVYFVSATCCAIQKPIFLVRHAYVTPIDYYDESDAIIESYNILERDIPTLQRILGLLKRNYFMPQDFSYKMAIEHINKLRQMFSKDEILAFPSIDSSTINIGLIAI